MQTQKDTEILVVRSSVSKLLFDVVEVDYFNETVDWIAKALDFEKAVEVIAELQEKQKLIEELKEFA